VPLVNYGTKGVAPIAFAIWMTAEACAREPKSKPYTPTSARVYVDEAPATAERPSNTPTGMREIDGEFCPEAEQVCLRWVDAVGVPSEPPEPGKTGRCGEFKNPSRCLTPEAQRPRKHFYIDTYEYPNVKGRTPDSWMTWRDVKKACESQGKRLCARSEWTMACEGPGLHPYPYGDGYHRDRTSCNTDNPMRGIDVFKAKAPGSEASRQLDAILVPSGAKPDCVSVWGVHDQVGNIDEQVVNEAGKPYRSGLMGGHVFGVRNACRPMTEAHNEDFGWYETGGRCCKDADK